MQLRYQQSTGSADLVSEDGTEQHLAFGWAGHGEGKNNPAAQTEVGVGPLPRAIYDIGEPFDHEHCGPFAMRLTPTEGSEMFGRDGFLIHGASQNPANYGQESNGCIVLPHSIRVAIYQSGAKRLEVIE